MFNNLSPEGGNIYFRFFFRPVNHDIGFPVWLFPMDLLHDIMGRMIVINLSFQMNLYRIRQITFLFWKMV